MSNVMSFAPRKKNIDKKPFQLSGTVRRRLNFDDINIPKKLKMNNNIQYNYKIGQRRQLFHENDDGNIHCGNKISPIFNNKTQNISRYAFYRGISEIDTSNALQSLKNFFEILFTKIESSILCKNYYDRYYIWDTQQHTQVVKKLIYNSSEDQFCWTLEKGTCVIDLCSLTTSYKNNERLLKSIINGYNSFLLQAFHEKTHKHANQYNHYKYLDDIVNERDVWSIQCFIGENGDEITDIVSAYQKLNSKWANFYNEQLRVEIKRDHIVAGDEFCLAFRTTFRTIDIDMKYQKKSKIFHAILIPPRLLMYCKIL